MTDRYKQLIVVLDHDIRSDDAEPLIEAIKLLRGVLTVHPDVTTSSDLWAEDRTRNKLLQQISEIFIYQRGNDDKS